jgi:hypothetical protein
MILTSIVEPYIWFPYPGLSLVSPFSFLLDTPFAVRQNECILCFHDDNISGSRAESVWEWLPIDSCSFEFGDSTFL